MAEIIMSEFFQDAPQLTNTFESNRWLKPYLKHKLPHAMFAHVEPDLHRLGELCAGEYDRLGRQAAAEKPELVQFDAWGKRIDDIKVSRAWVELNDISAREGLIHHGYKRAHGEFSRLYQFSKLYLFHPASGFYTCPLAMADGAARVLETYGKEDVHRQAFSHLTSDSPQEFWTSGQWMTEKIGGSDVSQTLTIAKMEGSRAKLFGTKWFSSATTSQMALALARIEGSAAGSKGLTLFMVPMRKADGSLNNLKVLRLKDKLGTWALPTAELQLEGAEAFMVGEKDQGVKTVTTMLNITRLYNSVCSIGQMVRGLELVRDYSKRRQVFGTPLNDQVLHYQTFAHEELKSLAGFLLTFEMVHLLGKEECGKASTAESEILRLMTPVTKLFTARTAVQTASEVVEGFGGAGYIEDTGVPVQLRDSQVFSIWEGATNVLSLDLLRVMQKGSAVESLMSDMSRRLALVKTAEYAEPRDHASAAVNELSRRLTEMSKASLEIQQASMRNLAFYLARLYAYVLLVEWGAKDSAVARGLLPWAALYREQFLGTWRPADSKDIQSARQVWDGSLTL
jgi:alkylation response protein AidB-like acyl-CoA dehydrogenase